MSKNRFNGFFAFLMPILWLFVLTLNIAAKPAPVKEIRKSQLPIPADSSKLRFIRVLILESQTPVVIRTESPYRVFDHEGRLLFSGNTINAVAVSAGAAAIRMGIQNFPSKSIRIETREGEIRAGEGVYTGALIFYHQENGKLGVINELPLEEYLKGVLPREMNAGWNEEALKAQAVASRTYALFRMIEKRDEPYDVSSDVRSQVYGGKKAQHPATNQAVDQTRGQILAYRDMIIAAFFHATCGGHTTRAETVWDIEKHPSLQGVECRFCQGTKHYRWEQSFSLEEMEKLLRKNGVPVSGLTGVMASPADRSGRAQDIFLIDKSGRRKLSSSLFRMYLDPFRFKSTLLTAAAREGKGYRFSGKGWGHGVGLCQYGSKKLAELGYNYRQILEHYYPHTRMIRYPPPEAGPS